MKKITMLAIFISQLLCIILIGIVWVKLSERNRVSSKKLMVASSSSSSSKRDDAEWVCANRIPGRNWCALDFTRLSVNADAIQARRLYILGYLAIDQGNLVLYADELDYSHGERGRSLQIMGKRDELRNLALQYGYKYIRLEGTFDQKVGSVRQSGRLGAMHPPFEVVPLVPRAGRETTDDLSVHITYMPPSKEGSVKVEKGPE